MPRSIAWCGLDLSSPECGRCVREPEQMVMPRVPLVVEVVAAEVQLAVVALVELEEVLVAPVVHAQVQLGVALGFVLDWDRSCGRVVELWSQ